MSIQGPVAAEEANVRLHELHRRVQAVFNASAATSAEVFAVCAVIIDDLQQKNKLDDAPDWLRSSTEDWLKILND